MTVLVKSSRTPECVKVQIPSLWVAGRQAEDHACPGMDR